MGQSASCEAYLVPYDNALRTKFLVEVDDFGPQGGSRSRDFLNFPSDADQDGLPDDYELTMANIPGNTFLPLNACSPVSDPLGRAPDALWDFDVSTREWRNGPQDQGWVQTAKGDGLTAWEIYRGFLDKDSAKIVRGGGVEYRLPSSWPGQFNDFGLDHGVYSRVYWFPFVKYAFLNSETEFVDSTYEGRWANFAQGDKGPQTFTKWLGFVPRWIDEDMYDPWARGQARNLHESLNLVIGDLMGAVNFTSAGNAQRSRWAQAGIKFRNKILGTVEESFISSIAGTIGTGEMRVNDLRESGSKVLAFPIIYNQIKIPEILQEFANLFSGFSQAEFMRETNVHELSHKTALMEHDENERVYNPNIVIRYEEIANWINSAASRNEFNETVYYPVLKQLPGDYRYEWYHGQWAKIEAPVFLNTSYNLPRTGRPTAEAPFYLLDRPRDWGDGVEVFIPEQFRQAGTRGYAFGIRSTNFFTNGSPNPEPRQNEPLERIGFSSALPPLNQRAGWYSHIAPTSGFAPEFTEQRQDIYQNGDLTRNP